VAVADPLLAHDDVEAFLIAWYRIFLAGRDEPICADVEVDRQEPADPPFPPKLLLINDDSGPTTSILTAQRSIRLGVLAGSVTNPQDAKDLARIVTAGASQIPGVDWVPGFPIRNPVASVDEINGPFLVPESQERARTLTTLTLSVTSTLL
jgi:hypothetical protein